MKKIYTLEQCKADMMQMWEWLYKNPGKRKKDFYKIYPDYPVACACCDYDEVNFSSNCSGCPIKWTSRDNECQSRGAEFYMWEKCFDNSNNCKDSDGAESWARRIYELAKGIKI